MRWTIENLKGLLEAIGGERFQEVSEKLAALDATQCGYVQTLSAMLNAESMTLSGDAASEDVPVPGEAPGALRCERIASGRIHVRPAMLPADNDQG
jgi:hypothetical protein